MAELFGLRCGICGTEFMLDKTLWELRKQQTKDGKQVKVYCPNGHANNMPDNVVKSDPWALPSWLPKRKD